MEKVLIINAYLNIPEDLVIWEIERENGEQADLTFVKSEFGSYLGIKKHIPDPLIEEFCKKIIGKTVNLSVQKK